jgi:transposase
MCLRCNADLAVPEETARVARQAFPRGNPYLRMRDEFGTLFADEQFADLFPRAGQPAETPWRLALVTVFQFAEGLSDRQAADAVRSRIDWKYALGLELGDAGFDFSVLAEFRGRLLSGGAEGRLLETLLGRFRQHGLVKPRSKQRTDATHVLAAVRILNRLELVGETMHAALNRLAVADPDWLRQQIDPDWFERYGRSFQEYRLPQGEAARRALAERIGADGLRLLKALEAAGDRPTLRDLEAVRTLRCIWLQQYWCDGSQLRWRTPEDGLPPATRRIESPYDPEARSGRKRTTAWVGYKCHVTETCDPDLPVLVTDVQTSSASCGDNDVLPEVQAALEKQDLLPSQQLVDQSYVEAKGLVRSQQYGIDLVGPAPKENSWQAQEGKGFAASDFPIDWERQVAFCPAGKQSVSWEVKPERGEPVVRVRFGHEDCLGCRLRADCTRSEGRCRQLTLRPEAEYRALQAARAREATPEFKQEHQARAGVEAGLSQGVRRCGLRVCRYTGQVKVHLQHLLTGAALNYVRVAAWKMAPRRERSRKGAFLRLLPTLA